MYDDDVWRGNDFLVLVLLFYRDQIQGVMKVELQSLFCGKTKDF